MFQITATMRQRFIGGTVTTNMSKTIEGIGSKNITTTTTTTRQIQYQRAFVASRGFGFVSSFPTFQSRPVCCHNYIRSFSTINNDQDVVEEMSPLRLALGSQKWQQLMSATNRKDNDNDSTNEENHDDVPAVAGSYDPSKNISYNDIVEAAIVNGINTIEIGQGLKGAADQALLNALQATHDDDVNMNDFRKGKKRLHLLKRVGYRSIIKKQQELFLPGDVHVEQMQSTVETGTSMNSSKDSERGENQTEIENSDGTQTIVVHNMGPHGIQAALEESPLVKALESAKDSKKADHGSLLAYSEITIMLHNPEVQATLHANNSEDHNLPKEEAFGKRQQRIRDKLVEAFLACEKQIAQYKNESGQNRVVSSYGIVSNGLSLPESHPLHLSWSHAIRPALQIAQEQLSQQPLHFSCMALPVNLLETTGLEVAQHIRNDMSNHKGDSNNDDQNAIHLEKPLELYALRPLTAYPDQGTGSSAHAFVLADYQLPATMKKKLVWSNEMTAPPEVYHLAMHTAMSHFDAEEILKAKMDGRELDTEQRETLDGCKLMQSIIHDVDNGLDQARSFSAHEKFLSEKIIPLIYDTFEGYDDRTATILEGFFRTYSLAVRYAIAKNTRKLLKEGEDSGFGNNQLAPPTYPDLPDSMRLQEYALRFLLSQKQQEQNHVPLFDKMIVGCAEVDHVLEDLEIVYQYLKSETVERQQEKKQDN